MRTKTSPKTSKLIFSHMVSEIEMLQEQNGYKIFSVSDCSYGAGAFEVTKELAECFADMRKRTLVINGDFYGSEKDSVNGIELSKGFSDFLMEEEELSLKDILSSPYSNSFFYIGRGSYVGSQKEQLLCSPKIQALLQAFCKTFDIIFLITPPLSAPVSGKLLCKASDTALLIAAMGQTGKVQLESARKQMDELNIPIAGVIATHSRKTAFEQFIGRFDKQFMK